jgi:diacylglycerol kinase (ATP)
MSEGEPFVAIVNPAAGGGKCGRRAPAALEELGRRGVRSEVHMTTAAGDATRIAREQVARGRRKFIAVGGDGTSYEILNGLSEQLGAANAEDRVSLGFLPLGTGNSFLRDFGGGGAAQAIEALVRGQSRSCDVMRLEHDTGVLHYLNLLSVGFVAEICALTNRHFKRFGASGYGLGVMVALAQLGSRIVRMRVDGGTTWEQAMVFVSVCNSRFTGGSMMMAPYASTDDGLADVVVCGEMNRFTLLSTFPKIFNGTHVHHHAITASRVRSLEFLESTPIDLMIDGEVVRHAPRRVDVCPAALDVLV